MKKSVLFLALVLLTITKSMADEGMWLPQLLQSLNEKEMKRMGMKISAADIYSINKSSLKDAIVSFGGFCTAEVISDKGLLLTNHHCGFDAIQNHSSLTSNYIQNGFWAKNFGEELPNKGLFATFIVRIEEVTKTVLAGLPAGATEKERQSLIDKNITQLRKEYKKETYEDLIIRPFFEGNKYYLFVTMTYKDVRLVGAPPSSIGNFGKDTDNWMWPRHTGDFSMFRIYAGKDNLPAAYSPDNVPYTPKRSLKISLKGLKEGDFTMVFGFPGRTNEYLTAAAVKQVMTVNDPAKIKIRHEALEIMNRYMRSDEKIKIQYAAKYASIENAYKKWQGEVLGLTRSGAVEKKLAYEAEFMRRVNANPLWKTAYADVLPKLNDAYKQIEPYAYARDYYTEIMPKIELMGIAADMNSLVNAYAKDEATYLKKKEEVTLKLAATYQEYNPKVDRSLFESLIELYIKDQPAGNSSALLQQHLASQQQTYMAVAADLYAKTAFCYPDSMHALLNKPAAEVVAAIKQDPAFLLYQDMFNTYNSQITPQLNEWQTQINQGQRKYMQAQLEVFAEKKFYPDANSTLRVTYGNVKPYEPRNAVKYHYITYMDGIFEKYQPGDYEFDVPQKLLDLYKAKDFGRYGVNGKQPVCFIAANHTTGGNSGSPALDAYGNLVGLNFDRVWEGTMSDINYDPSICRNIMVDIRYILFIVDKFAGATNLISELNIIASK